MTKFNEPEPVLQLFKNADFCLKFTLLFGIQLNLAYFDDIEICRLKLNSKQTRELHFRCSFLLGIQFNVMWTSTLSLFMVSIGNYMVARPI